MIAAIIVKINERRRLRMLRPARDIDGVRLCGEVIVVLIVLGGLVFGGDVFAVRLVRRF